MGRGGSSPLIRTLRRLAILCASACAVASLAGSGVAAGPVPTTEVIVTLDAPSLIARSLTTAHPRTSIAAVQARAEARLRATIPSVQIVYRYRLVADGFALVVPTKDVGRLAKIPGVAKVWPNLAYHELTATRVTVRHANQLNQGPQVIGADKRWGSG